MSFGKQAINPPPHTHTRPANTQGYKGVSKAAHSSCRVASSCTRSLLDPSSGSVGTASVAGPAANGPTRTVADVALVGPITRKFPLWQQLWSGHDGAGTCWTTHVNMQVPPPHPPASAVSVTLAP